MPWAAPTVLRDVLPNCHFPSFPLPLRDQCLALSQAKDRTETSGGLALSVIYHL